MKLFVNGRSNIVHPFHQTAHFSVLIPNIFLRFGSDYAAQTEQCNQVRECHTCVQCIGYVPNNFQSRGAANQYNDCPCNTERLNCLYAYQIYPCTFTVIATKADKISRGARQKQLAPICRALLVQPWEVICWSSEDGTGRDQLLTLLEKVLAPEEEAPEA